MIFILAAILIVPLFFIRKKRACIQTDRTFTSLLGLFAILLFFINSFSYFNHSSLNVFDFSLPYNFIYLFASPLFFYSGYKAYTGRQVSNEKGVIRNSKLRVVKIVLSFLILWMLFAAITLYTKKDYSLSYYFLSFLGMRSIGNLYIIIPALITSHLASFFALLLSKSSKNNEPVFLFFLLYLFAVILCKITKDYRMCVFFVCYIVGFFFSKKNDVQDRAIFKKKTASVVSLLLLILSLSLLLVVFFIFDYLSSGNNFYSAIILIILSLLICSTCFVLTILIDIKSRLLSLIGKNFILIYLIQNLLLSLFAKISFIYFNNYVFFFASLLATIIVSIIFSAVFDYVWKIIFLKNDNCSESTNVRVGIAISYISLFVSIIGSFVVTPILLNRLGDAQYGLRSFATSIATWLSVVSTALGASYLRFINQSSKKDGIGEDKMNNLYFKIFSFVAVLIFGITIVGTAICFLFRVKFGNYTPEENNIITTLIFISGLNLSVVVFTSLFTHYLSYRHEFIFVRGLALIISILTFVLELVFVSLTKSVVAIATTTAFLSIVSGSCSIFFAMKKKRMPFKQQKISESKGIIKSIVIFSFFIVLNSVVDQINSQVDITILGVMTNSTNVTFYTLSRSFVSYLLALSISISSIFAPKIHKLVSENDYAGLNNLFLKVSSFQMIVLLLAVGGFASCGREFIMMWLGDSREAVYFYSLALLSLNVIPLSCNFCIEVQRAMNKHKFRAILYIILALSNVGISITLIYFLPQHLSIWGAIIGTVTSTSIGNIIILNVYNSKVIGIRMKPYFANVLKHLLITLISFALVTIIKHFLHLESNVLLFVLSGLMYVCFYIPLLMVVDNKIVLPLMKKIVGKAIDKVKRLRSNSD